MIKAIRARKPAFFKKITTTFGPEWKISFSQKENEVSMKNDFLTKEIFETEHRLKISKIVNPNLNGWEAVLQQGPNGLRIVVRKNPR